MTDYKSTPASGIISELRRKLDGGDARLSYNREHGYLESVLGILNISTESQILVASRTSPNRDFISPGNPRALYFNDRAWVAYVPSAPLLEIVVTDPKLGVVFYTMSQSKADGGRFIRDDRCLECHASSKTLDVPGLLARSFLTRGNGEVDLLDGITVNHKTSISRRWGGYYVTGAHGSQTHFGNVFGGEAIKLHAQDPLAYGNLTNLSRFIQTLKYPAQGSDIVALLVQDHEVQMENLLIRLGADFAHALPNDTELKSINPTVDALLKYMLFVDEASMASPIAGAEGFRSWFENQGPRDKLGRSLRQFDLENRLFKYPCSFMIYSPAFEQLPIAARKRVYHRLWMILTNEKTSDDFSGLSQQDKRAILEILLATKRDLPEYWRL